MAQKGFGAMMNSILNAIGLVDADEEPQRSNRARDDYDSDRRGSSYTPSARRNDRPQQSRPRNDSRSGYNSDRRGTNNNNRSRNTRAARDQYSEWDGNTRAQGRYGESIYDDDTTLRGNAHGYDDDFYRDQRETTRRPLRDDFDDNRYDDSYEDRRPAPRNARNDQYEAEEHSTALEPRNARSCSGEVVVFDVGGLEDCRMVILSLLDNKTVIISVESLDKAMIRRVEDTLCGAVCALNATIRRTSDVSYLIAPSSVEVRGTRRTVERHY